MKAIYLVFAFIILAVISFIIFVNPAYQEVNSSDYRNIRLPFDEAEMEIYFDRVAYYYNDAIPYEYNDVEYPLVGLMYLTLPATFTENFDAYRYLLYLQNIICLGLLIYLTHKIIKKLDGNQKLLWLFLLPSFLYFVVNRFDIFPAVILQFALLFLFKEKFVWSFAMVSLAFLAKGYSLFIFPVFLIYYLNKKAKRNIFFNAPMAWLIFPVLILLSLLILLVGVDNALFPYIFQSTRTLNIGTIYTAAWQSVQPIFSVSTWQSMVKFTSILLTILQIILPLTIYFGYKFFKKNIRTKKDLILWSLLSLLFYILFSPYNSPQWIIWILPLLIFIKWNKWELSLIIIYDFVNFLFFPLLFDLYLNINIQFNIVVVLRTILLLLLIFVTWKKIRMNMYDNKLLSMNPS